MRSQLIASLYGESLLAPERIAAAQEGRAGRTPRRKVPAPVRRIRLPRELRWDRQDEWRGCDRDSAA